MTNEELARRNDLAPTIPPSWEWQFDELIKFSLEMIDPTQNIQANGKKFIRELLEAKEAVAYMKGVEAYRGLPPHERDQQRATENQIKIAILAQDILNIVKGKE